MVSNKKKWYVNLLLCLGSVVVGLLLLEFFLREFAPLYFADNHGVYQYDKVLQIVPRKDVDLKRIKDYLEEYKTNHLGTTNYQSDFSSYRHLVFALGDSYTEGVGLPPDAAYPFQLDLLLNIDDKKYQTNYAVVNLGLASYGGEQYVQSLKRFIKLIGKPDFILVLGCSNDYGDDLRFKAFQSGKTFELIEGNPRYDLVMKPLSYLGYETEIGKRVLEMVRNYRTNYYRKTDLEQNRKNFCTAEKEMPIYEELAKIAKGCNARLIVSWATRDASYDWLKQWAESQQIAFADWAPTVASVRKNLPGLPLWNPHSGGHYRTWVNHIIAESFAQKIRNPEAETAASGIRSGAEPVRGPHP
jgi:lysophospholipase L1-like esterase